MESEIVNSVQENSGNIWVVVSTIAAAVSAVFAAIAAGISLWQAREFRKQVAVDMQLRKIQQTVELNPHYSEEYIRCSKFLFTELTESIKNRSISDDEWKSLSKNIELMGAISQIIHFWARFAICYYAGVLDRDTARMSCQGGFFWMMQLFGDRLKKMEDVSGSHLLLKLYDEWK